MNHPVERYEIVNSRWMVVIKILGIWEIRLYNLNPYSTLFNNRSM